MKVENSELIYKAPNGTTQALKGPLLDRAINALNNGASAETILPIMRFMDNISKNKLKDIRDELYQFMASGKMPITIDGCFLAYKRVRADFLDCHSGTMDNSPGKLVSMPQDKVDTNRHNECSRGLHFCSRDYLRSFGGAKTVVVKVNPRYVFAIPTDYNYAKGRASEYYVVGECKADAQAQELFLESYVFDENKQTAAPQVEFIPTGLKVSLLAMAESYGLVADGQALVAISDSKGLLPTASRFIVYDDGNSLVSAITGQLVDECNTKLMSVTTKSVRPLLVRAVAKARNRNS